MRIAFFLLGLMVSIYVSAIAPIGRDRIVATKVECVSFTGDQKVLSLNVMDTLECDVVETFRCLKSVEFPIYTTSCYAPRNIEGSNKVSLHAYGAAVDVNYLMNPYYDVLRNVIIPGRDVNRGKDERDMVHGLESIGLSETEISEVLSVVIQPEGSDDWFLNRGFTRKGMVTPEIADVFKSHGFNIWGGMWRQPMDYMHFQIPRDLAEQLAVDDHEKPADALTNRELWEQHKARVCR